MRSSRLPADASHLSSFRYWNRGGVALLNGNAPIYPLAHVWLARLALRGLQLHLIDCAIRADAESLAEEALRQGVAPELLLEAITLQRAFTPYQILDVLERELERESKPERIVFIMAPCKQFFDGDVAQDEAAFLLKKMVERFRRFGARGRPLLIVESAAYPSVHFAPALTEMRALADTLFDYQGQDGPGRYGLAVRRRDNRGGWNHKILDHNSNPRTGRGLFTKKQKGLLHGPHDHTLFDPDANGGGTPQGLSARLAAG